MVYVSMLIPPLFQSTPPAREETALALTEGQRGPISIHSSRTGGDDFISRLEKRAYISIHSSRMGGDALTM